MNIRRINRRAAGPTKNSPSCYTVISEAMERQSGQWLFSIVYVIALSDITKLTFYIHLKNQFYKSFKNSAFATKDTG